MFKILRKKVKTNIFLLLFSKNEMLLSAVFALGNKIYYLWISASFKNTQSSYIEKYTIHTRYIFVGYPANSFVFYLFDIKCNIKPFQHFWMIYERKINTFHWEYYLFLTSQFCNEGLVSKHFQFEINAACLLGIIMCTYINSSH